MFGFQKIKNVKATLKCMRHDRFFFLCVWKQTERLNYSCFLNGDHITTQNINVMQDSHGRPISF